MPTEVIEGLVNQQAPRAAGEGAEIGWKFTKRGEACIIGFFEAMYLEQRAYQIRAGSVSAPLTGTTAITNLQAEMSADVVGGITMIPTYFNMAIQTATGTANEVRFAATGSISSGGTVFVPLPLFIGGRAAVSTGRVQATGNVVVVADVVTTTRAIAMWGNGIIAGAYTTTFIYKARLPHIVVGGGGVYVANGGSTGHTYFANFEYIEIPTVNID